MNIKSILSTLGGVNWLKTFYFNFYYFSFGIAICLPVFIYKHTNLVSLKGRIIIRGPVKTGIIRIGQGAVGTLDIKYSRTIFQCYGIIVFNGSASIGSGTRLSVNKAGVLTFGDNFCVTGGSSIICSKQITFGRECLLSWDILIMDSDFHHIYNEKQELINPPKSILIGDHVWIGCRTMILKGVNIRNNNVIAAGSKITNNVIDEYSIVSGVDTQRIIKRNVKWVH